MSCTPSTGTMPCWIPSLSKRGSERIGAMFATSSSASSNGSLEAPGGRGDRQVDRVRAEPIQKRGDQRRELLLDTRRRDHIERALLGDQLPKVDLRCDGRVGGGSDGCAEAHASATCAVPSTEVR